MNEKTWRLRRLCVIALLTAMAYAAVALLRIPVVAFLKYEPKDVLLVIGGFLFGPAAGAIMSAVVALIEMVTISDTGLIGFVMNLLSSGLFVCLAAGIYRHDKTLRGAVIGLVCGSLAMTAGIRRVLTSGPEVFDPREYLKVGRDEVKKMVKHKIKDVLGSENTL